MNGDSLTVTLIPCGRSTFMVMILLPKALVHPILKHLHEEAQYGRGALMDLIRPHSKGPHYTSLSALCQKQS